VRGVSAQKLAQTPKPALHADRAGQDSTIYRWLAAFVDVFLLPRFDVVGAAVIIS
jgi:hypothetical protein